MKKFPLNILVGFIFLTTLRGYCEKTQSTPLESLLPIPERYSVLESRYKGTIENDIAHINASYRVRILEGSNIKIPLLSKEAAITDMSLPKNVILVIDNSSYSLVFPEKGEYSFTLTFALQVNKNDTINSLSLGLCESAISQLLLTLPGKGLDISISPNIGFVSKELSREKTQVTAYIGTQNHITITWKAKPSSLKAAHPVFNSETHTLIDIQPEAIRATTLITYQILQGNVRNFTISLPENINLLTVKGDSLRNWNIVQEKSQQVLSVELTKEVTGTYQLILEIDYAQESFPETFLIPQFTTKQSERSTGYFAIIAHEDFKLQPIKKEGITQINENQLPPMFRRLITKDISFAYQAPRIPYFLAFALKKIQPEVYARNNTFIYLNEETINCTSLIDYTIEKAGVFTFSVQLPLSYHLTDIKGEHMETWETVTNPKGQVVTVHLRKKALGKYRLRVQMEKQFSTRQDVFQGITAPQIKVLNVKKETGYVGLSNVSNLRLRAVEKNNIVEIDPQELITAPQGIQQTWFLAYKYLAHPFKLVLSVEAVEPRVKAETFTLLSVGEGVLLVNTAITYTILHAGINEFLITLPAQATGIEFTGTNIKSQQKQPSQDTQQNQVWKVTLHAKTKGTYTLYCSFEQLTHENVPAMSLPQVALLNVERETGYYCIGQRSNLEIIPAQVQGATQIDIKELPRDKTEGIDIPLVLAYKYIKHPYAIDITVTRHEDVSVLVALAESVQITSVLTEEGQFLVSARYFIKNKQKQYLNFTLPENTHIWSTFVNNKPVKPGKTNEGKYLIPLERSSDTDTPYPVEIIYETKRPSLKLIGNISFLQPQLDIPLTNITWNVYLPENISYFNFRGNVKKPQSSSSFRILPRRSQRARQDMPAQMLEIDRIGENTYDRKKEKSQFYDENEYAAPKREGLKSGEIEEEEKRLVQKDLQFLSNVISQAKIHEQQPQDSLVSQVKGGRQTGVLPIRLTIPTGGKLFTFTKLLSNNELLTIKVSYHRGHSRLLGILLWCAVIYGMILIIRARKQKRSQPIVSPE